MANHSRVVDKRRGGMGWDVMDMSWAVWNLEAVLRVESVRGAMDAVRVARVGR